MTFATSLLILVSLLLGAPLAGAKSKGRTEFWLEKADPPAVLRLGDCRTQRYQWEDGASSDEGSCEFETDTEVFKFVDGPLAAWGDGQLKEGGTVLFFQMFEGGRKATKRLIRKNTICPLWPFC